MEFRFVSHHCSLSSFFVFKRIEWRKKIQRKFANINLLPFQIAIEFMIGNLTSY